MPPSNMALNLMDAVFTPAFEDTQVSVLETSPRGNGLLELEIPKNAAVEPEQQGLVERH